MRRRAAFTLIEMMAVVLIFALMAAAVMPNLDLVKRRAVRREADQLAAQIELARQRSVVTSVPHRLYLDLEAGGYRLEWLGSDAPPEGPADLFELDLRGKLSLEAPPQPGRDYRPLPGEFGRLQWLDEDVLFAGVETDAGWLERGEAFIGFERDGSTSYALIVLSTEEGDAVEIEVLPLAQVARVRRAEG